ncbi:MAG TPA: site-specific integrase [Candidatus Limnocylindrales bacterium]|nr:site-specific integrase [Candidatus Limnocylindrales bacterium]
MIQRGIFEKVSDSGEFWIRYADATGRIRRERVGTFEEARSRLRLRKEEAKLGTLPRLAWRRRPVIFRKMAEDALTYADQHKRSAADDHIRMKKLLEWFAARAGDTITPREIELHFQAEKWTPATWNRYRALLSLIYRLAIRAGKVKENPARLVQHKAENNGRVRFLSREEEENLRKVIREKFPEHEPELDLALQTGLRSAEQYGTRWKDVDFERRVLTIPLDKGGKTSHVPLSAAVLRALLDLRRQHGNTELVCGGARSPRHWFEAAAEAAKIEGFTWHCLRHTFASRLVMSGADLRTVAELLRDKTLEMVMRYAHLAPDHKLAAIERMATAFPEPTTDTKLTPTILHEKPVSSLMQ